VQVSQALPRGGMDNLALSSFLIDRSRFMGNKIITEADRKASPRVKAPAGLTFTTGKGQKVSKERGSHTRSKKNPGKRPHKGG
jgi:hypothetical protein